MKKMSLKKVVKKIGLSLLGGAFVLLWTTCDVGLGEAVDTMAPTVSVTAPAASSVIAGAVDISGTCGDDKGVASVNVVVTNTTTGAKFECSAEIEEMKSWKTTVNQFAQDSGYPLVDGSYTVDVTAVDLYGRTSGTSSTAFDIDNTEPIFCVTSPASLDISNPRKYGRSVTISGEIADDHDIAKMDIRVFKYENGSSTEITQSLAKTTFTDFETAGGTTVYIAKYFDNPPESDSDDYLLYQNYMAIYGSTALGQDVNIFVVPTLTDIAGNTSGQSYVSTELKSLIASECGVDASIDSLQTAQLQKIYNGTYSLGELNDEQKSKVLELMNGKSASVDAYYCSYNDDDGARKKPLAACVNSNNSPRYAFSGYELDMSNIAWSEINTGGTLSVSVTSGLDDWGVLPNTIKVCLTRCADTGIECQEGDSLYKKFTSDEDEGFAITNALGESISGISTSVSAQSYYVTLPKLSSGEHYILTATGVDEDGNALYPAAEKYGLKVASTGATPKIDFEDRYYIKGSEVLTGGSASAAVKINDGTDTINSGEADKYVEVKRKLYSGHISSKGYLGNNSPQSEDTDTFSAQIQQVSTNEYTLEVPLNKYAFLAEGNYTLALEITAKNSSGEVTSTYIVWIDNAKPSVTITAPVEGGNVYNTDSSVSTDGNGNYYYTPYGNWSDKDGSGTSALWYSIEDTGSEDPTISGNAADGWTITGNDNGSGGHYAWNRISGAVAAETETSWEQKLGPVTESKGNFIKMIAVDAVGNISDVVKKENVTYDFALPTIALKSEPGASSPVNVNTYYNSYVAANSSGKLEFVLAANDSLALADSGSISVSAKKWNKSARSYEAISSGSGGYTCEAIALATDNKSATVSINLDANGTADGLWSFVVRSEDSCGRKSGELSFSTTIDRTRPELVDYDSEKPIVIKGSGLVDDWYKDEALSVMGKFNEAASGSGIYRIYYWLGTPSAQKSGSYVVPSDLTAAGNSDGYIEISSSANTGSSVEYTISPSGFEEMQYNDDGAALYNNLYIQAIDIAGNKSELKGPYQIKEDRAEPVFEAKYYTYDGSTFSAANGTAVSNGKNDMTLYGTASDALSGIKEITFAIGETSKSPTITYTTDTLSGSETGSDYAGKSYSAYSDMTDENKTKITGWKAVIAKENLDTGSLYAKASDRAGNATSNHKLFDIGIDKDSPTVTLTTPVTKLCASKYVDDGTDKDGSDSASVAAVNGTITISGTASDGNLQSVAVYVGTDSTTGIVSGDKRLQEFTGTSMYNWSVSNKFSYIEGEEFKFSDGATFDGSGKNIYIKVHAKDSAANERVNVYQYSVNPDSDRPVIKLFKPLNGMTSDEANYKWVTNDTTISGSISDDDGIEEITATYTLYDSKTSTWGTPVAATVTNSNGSFQVSGLKDGRQIITFTVKDSAGTTFTAHAGATSSYLAPKIVGNDASSPQTFGADKDSDTLLYIKVDTSLPTTRNVTYSYYDAAASPPGYTEFSSTLETYGGKRKKLKIQFEAYDENGIDSVLFCMTDGTTPQSISGTIDSANPDSDGYVKCSIDDIQINDTEILESGTFPATIVVTDKALLKSTSTYNITVDNTAPAISITSPKDEQGHSGKITAYGSVDKATLSYGISKNDSDAPAYKEIESSLSWFIYFDGDTAAKNHDITLKDYLISLGVTTQEAIDEGAYTTVTPLYIWMKAVDDVGNESLEKFKINVDPQGDKPQISISNPSANGTTVGGKIRVYGSAADNEAVKAVFVQIISGYHDTSIMESGTWGTFAHSGGTTDVTAFNLTADDLNYLSKVQANGQKVYKIYKMATYDPDDSSTWTEWSGSGEPSDYGVLANLNNGKSWYLYINSNDEFADASETNSVAMRAFAIDAIRTSGSGSGTANVSQGALRQMTFDANAPTITTPNVRKYSATVTGTASYDSTEAYKEDMYVKGQTWLSFTIHDTSAIGTLEVGLSNANAAGAVSDKKTVTLPSATDTDATTDGIICRSPSSYTDEQGNSTSATKNQYVNVLVPLDTDSGVGTQYIYINFADTSGTSTLENYVIRYDNTAPVLASVADSGYSISPSAQQSNGWYSFGSKVTESDIGSTKQSGFERVAFYFMRRDTTASGTPTYIYDPMIKKGALGNKVTVSDSLEYSDGLYWTKQPVTRTDSKNTVTLSSAQDNIHPYGLAKIGGTIYTITSVNGTTLVVDGEPEGNSGSTQTAYFAIGNVVDHLLTESPAGHNLTSAGYGYGYAQPSSDDGDLMVESVKQDGTDWTWSASVYSKNIPDGPIELHYVAFDAAGNCAKGIVGCASQDTYKTYSTADVTDSKAASPSAPVSVYAYAQASGSTIYSSDKAAYVSNNAPRLANIFAGTDLDGDDEVSEEEMSAKVYETSLTDWDSAKSSLVLGTVIDDAAIAKFTAKGKTIIRPEIIGGNGALYYSYKISGKDSSANTYTISGNNANVFMAADTGGADSREDQAKSVTADITLPVGDFINLAHDSGSANTSVGILDCSAASPAALELTFWDSTEVTKKFVDSQTAKATVYMGVALRDGEAPAINIEPLYWKKLTDNSIYASSGASSYADLKGHIELPKDLEATTSWTSTFTDTSGEMDKDPKLSGIVVLTGTVSDNKMLSKVFMSITNGTDGMDGSGGGFDSAKVDSANTDNCKTDGTAVTAYPLAKYEGGSWTVADKLEDYGVKFEISDNDISESGHSARWTFTWDTSFVRNLAATDLKVKIFASDMVSTAAAGSAQTSINGSTKYAAPAFSDVNYSVGESEPTADGALTSYYKVDVVPYITGLDTAMTAKGAAYGRTSSGRYPVYFYKNSASDSGGAMTTQAGASITVKGFNLAAKNASVAKTVSDSGADITASGDYYVTVNSVKTLNNSNNDDAYGSYDNLVADSAWKNNTSAAYTSWKNYPNRQPNKENNLRLTDNVAIDVWQINNKAAVPLSGIANDVTMKINQSSGMVGFAFVNGPLNFAMPNGKESSYNNWARSYDFCKSASLAIDDGGNAYGTIAGGDTGEKYADAFGLYSSKWTDRDFGDKATQESSKHQRRLESVGQKGSKNMTVSGTTYTNSNSGNQYQTDQWKIVSPSLATTYSGGSTNLYLAYYDQMNDEIRFRAGTGVPESVGDFGNFNDRFSYTDQPYTTNAQDVQIVAQENSPVAKPGPYVSIAASNKSGSDVVAMVWHDPVANCMWYSCNTEPTTSRANKINNQSGTDQGWSKPVKIFSGVTGEYCQVAFDKEGKVHIAAYDSGAGDLWYAYLSNYSISSASEAKTCVVDSYGYVGSQITLDVAYSSSTLGKPIPYIGYLAEGKTLPKLAYYAGADITSDIDINGTSGNYFTGKWEASVVPTVTQGIQGEKGYDRINVGVWKDGGVLKNSTSGTSFYYKSGNVADADSYGVVYGNGTSNPALSYRYESGSNGYVEMAQKK